MKNKRVVVIGGGTGTFAVLSGLKRYLIKLTAIVAMADDGGSTGVLRDELGVLPPGDIRQCIVALSRSDKLMRDLMNYRFLSGKLKGHNFGNLLLSALQKTTGGLDTAIETLSKILRVDGNVIPSTLSRVRLVAYLENNKIVRGEHNIDTTRHTLKRLKNIALEPRAKANPAALRALKNADLIVIAPGDIYTGIVPNFLVPGIAGAAAKSKAKKLYICNLMNKKNHTDGFTILDYAEIIKKYLGSAPDYIIYNTRMPSAALIKRYARKGETHVAAPRNLPKNFIGADLLSRSAVKKQKADSVRRSFVRHDPKRLAKIIMKFLT